MKSTLLQHDFSDQLLGLYLDLAAPLMAPRSARMVRMRRVSTSRERVQLLVSYASLSLLSLPFASSLMLCHHPRRLREPQRHGLFDKISDSMGASSPLCHVLHQLITAVAWRTASFLFLDSRAQLGAGASACQSDVQRLLRPPR